MNPRHHKGANHPGKDRTGGRPSVQDAGEPLYWIIAYDISGNRHRSRAARRLEKAGLRVQKSVFLVQLSPKQLRRLFRELAPQVDHQTDQVTAWPLGRVIPEKDIQVIPHQHPVLQETIVW